MATKSELEARIISLETQLERCHRNNLGLVRQHDELLNRARQAEESLAHLLRIGGAALLQGKG